MKHTKCAFLFLLLHAVYAALFALCVLIAGLLEVPCDRDGLYTVFAAALIAMLLFYPLAATFISVKSVFFQIKALRAGESKWKNILMMCIALVCLIPAAFLAIRLWHSMTYG